MRVTKAAGTEVTVPHLAESLVSATIGKWMKKPGDYVEQYEVLCELITEKVNAEMPSPVEGVLKEILAEEGETVEVGGVICIIEEPGSATEATGQAVQHEASSAYRRGFEAADGDSSMRHRYSPAVQHLANEYRLDLTQIAGTGMGGRITRKDVREFIEGRQQRRPPAVDPQQADHQASPGREPADRQSPVRREEPQRRKEPLTTEKVPVRSTGLHLSETPRMPLIEVEPMQDTGRGEYFIDVTPIRNTIATRMRQSVTEIPHAWMMIEVDVTNLVLLRNKLKDEFRKQEGINLTYLAFMLKAVVNAIKDYPILNSVWAVDKIIVKKDINISLAVGTEDSVITPVIKKADRMNIAGLAREVDELSRRARTGKLKLDEVLGGTITVNNTGSFGSILSYPIINYPQAANLSFESIVKRPVVINDMIAVRSMVNICLSLDHRILDGLICGRFLQRLKENLEAFGPDTQLY
ncbi:dihydrolipoamide acetyltransferase family protein [Ferviditalea candida]|uniref:Dihydrolipoamide acetyltransferase component of pyruvate dehydrogenase complex n=1 Tax=Ferviditalea candida TaxID=3108399 RepID=A0ABU5ZQ81_9BACL|nr:dihydrolipoamide acetyltransferase family protein [Paenibacillaceae bacterium T2]